MRDIFIEELISSAKKNKKLILIVNDLGYGIVEKFANLFPKQFINAGVAEQNMMGLAAGLAIEKNHVFVYSIGNFSTFRCAEQIRNDVDYHKLPVTIVNVGAGVSYGPLGYSHHSLQDYSLIRCMPNTLIASPSESDELKKTLKFLLKKPQSSYLRISKAKNTFHYSRKKKQVMTPGTWNLIKKGISKKTFLITGNTLNIAYNLISQKKYENYSIYSIPLWGMKYKKNQANQAKNFKHIISIEDHLYDGGFGSWLNESFLEYGTSTKLSSIYLKEKIIGKVGSEEFLLKKYLKKI